MTVSMDRAGRLVLPKPVRERYGLRAGVELEIREEPGGIVIVAPSQESPLFWEDGLLIHRGRPKPGVRWDQIVDDVREERLRETGGYAR